MSHDSIIQSLVIYFIYNHNDDNMTNCAQLYAHIPAWCIGRAESQDQIADNRRIPNGLASITKSALVDHRSLFVWIVLSWHYDDIILSSSLFALTSQLHLLQSLRNQYQASEYTTEVEIWHIITAADKAVQLIMHLTKGLKLIHNDDKIAWEENSSRQHLLDVTSTA